MLLYLGRCAVATVHVAVCGIGSWYFVIRCGLPRSRRFGRLIMNDHARPSSNVMHGACEDARRACANTLLYFSSCTRTLEHSKTKWYWVNHGRTIMHSNTRQAKSRQARALKRQASCLLPVDAFTLRSTRRRGNHMHDHSRFQRDIDWRHRRLSLSLSLSQCLTGVSLSLSLYYSQKSLTHNIGNASAFPIIYRLELFKLWLKVSMRGKNCWWVAII